MLLVPFLFLCSALAVPVTQKQDTSLALEPPDILLRSSTTTHAPGITARAARSSKKGAGKPAKTSAASTKANVKPSSTLSRSSTRPTTTLSTEARSGSSTHSSSTLSHTSSSAANSTGTSTQTSTGTSTGSKTPVIIYPSATAAAGQKKFTNAAKDGKTPIEEVKFAPSDSSVWIWLANMTAEEIKRYNTTANGVTVVLDKQITIEKPKKALAKGPSLDQLGKEQEALTGKNTTTKRGLHSFPKRVVKGESENDGDGVFYQEKAPYELSMISQSKNAKKVSTDYWYNGESGAGVDVYYIDSGLNKAHQLVQDWQKGRAPPKGSPAGTPNEHIPTLSWINPENTAEDDPDTDGHGSHVWSKLVGQLGVAKYANIIVGKPKFTYDDVLDANNKPTGEKEWSTLESDVLLVLRRVASQIEAQKKTKSPRPAVVSMSLSLDGTAAEQPPFLEACKTAFKRLSTSKVSVFYSTENTDGDDGKVEHLVAADLPVMSLSRTLDNFFVVGGVDQKGDYSKNVKQDDQKTPIITFYAPADQVTVIPYKGTTGTELDDGASFATPLAAGLAAYFLSLKGHQGWDPQEVKKEMVEWAWQRTKTGPAVIANEYRDEEAGSDTE